MIRDTMLHWEKMAQRQDCRTLQNSIRDLIKIGSQKCETSTDDCVGRYAHGLLRHDEKPNSDIFDWIRGDPGLPEKAISTSLAKCTLFGTEFAAKCRWENCTPAPTSSVALVTPVPKGAPS